MTTERSDKVYETWRQASEKFDYFILGVNGALCAYITQTYKFEKIEKKRVKSFVFVEGDKSWGEPIC